MITSYHLALFSVFGWWFISFTTCMATRRLFSEKLSAVIFNAHIVNSIIALAFFYFIPYFAITPKTNLFIFLVVSF